MEKSNFFNKFMICCLFSLVRSANFTFNISDDEIKFEVIGYGHGVGMSQTGADSMAKEGSGYEEIIDLFLQKF